MHSAARWLVVIVPLFLLMGCATTTTNADQTKADLKIEQLPDAGFAVEDRGAV
jgi:uncharacterized protein YcfL